MFPTLIFHFLFEYINNLAEIKETYTQKEINNKKPQKSTYKGIYGMVEIIIYGI